MLKKVLDQLTLIVLDVNLWSCQRSLLETDLKLTAGQELPPAQLAKLGNKFIYDPQRIRPFQALKMKASRTLDAVGTRFLGARAVPRGLGDEILERIDPIEKEFFELREQEFEPNHYLARRDEWVSKNPGWESIILSAAITAEEAKEKLHFSSQSIVIVPSPAQEKRLEKAVAGLPGQLRREIEVAARQAWKQSFQGKTQVTQKAMHPINALLQKLQGLAFLEPELKTLFDGLVQTMDIIPKKGVLKGQHLAAACGMLSLMGNIPEADMLIPEESAEEVEDNESSSTVVVSQMPSAWF